MTLTPSQGRNHNFPSGVLATCGWKWPGLERLLTTRIIRASVFDSSDGERWHLPYATVKEVKLPDAEVL